MDLITLAMAKAYTDNKGGYVEPGKVMWKGKLTATDDRFSAVNFDNPIGLEVGKSYTVTTDSGTYTGISKEYGNTIVIGNTAIMGGDDSGESYTVIEALADEPGSVLDFNGGTSATISTHETIHPIDPKFLPKGGVGYVETDTKIVLPETVSNADEVDTTWYYIHDFTPEAGKTYEVIIDGKSSVTTAFLFEDEDNKGIVLGNLGLMESLENAGEDYVIIHDLDASDVFLIHRTKVYPETITLSINEVKEIVHKIDQKFLPNTGGLPFAQITTEIPVGSEAVILSEDENAILNTAIQSKSPIIVLLDINDGTQVYTVSGLATFQEIYYGGYYGTAYVYTLIFGTKEYMFDIMFVRFTGDGELVLDEGWRVVVESMI